MRKLPDIAICVLAAILIFAGAAPARHSSATNSSTAPPAASAPAMTDNSASAAKPAPTAKPAATPASKTQNATSSPNGTSTQTSGAAKTQSGTATKTPAGAATQHHAAAPLVLKTDKDKETYAIGLNIGKSIHRDGVEVDPNILSRGMKDALSGAKPALTDDEAKAVMMSLQTRVRKQQAEQAQVAAEAAKKVGEANKAAGDAFLAANKTKEGIVTLPSGLQYKILTQGTGPKPTAADTVVCNYKGTLLDNTEFDASSKHGGPATFPVGGVIKGWTEALQLMPVGSKWQLFVPADLAYGQRAMGPDITPGATLIFEVELLSIKAK